jgi:hypothetical protein
MNLCAVQRAVKGWRGQQARRIIVERAAVIVSEIRIDRASPGRYAGFADPFEAPAVVISGSLYLG